ncbi:hypothetical protein HPP92_021404 [Vanilla planifolia]|uniref:Uncharacterized protein n=1 Tax=Vanilla planifolia TaxID=51239 RepID=A0A835PX75_VANPL|nr:hypothetical protein HPP92_021776 [Vanilla planifolia]KAG0462928.1 hypothetical protein HPP92_021404 [Vanilla planifolia]
MESSSSSTVVKRLWHVLRVAYYMLRKGISKRKLLLDVHLLLKRGKLARKALGSFMTFHHHHHNHHGGPAAFSFGSFHPDASLYASKEVQFSCSNTPSSTGGRNRRRGLRVDAAEMADWVFEMLNAEASEAEEAAEYSPFALMEIEDVAEAGEVDWEAEEFIKRRVKWTGRRRSS